MAAGMFGAVFNTPGDVIRSSIQNRFLASKPVIEGLNPIGGVKCVTTSHSFDFAVVVWFVWDAKVLNSS
jgi:hypothetical protein